MGFRTLAAGLIVAATAVCTALAPPALAATGAIPLAPFNECPAVGQAASCAVLIVINPDRSVSIYGDPAVGDYDGGDDSLVGVRNQSTQAVTAITVSGPAGSNLAGFDGDGICAYGVSCGGLSGYEGPGTAFVLDPASTDRVEVDFPGAGLAPGGSTYFGLEGTLNAASLGARQGTLTNCSPISVSSSVSTLPLNGDPATSAFVKLSVHVVNADGTPTAGALIGLSNANPTVPFHTGTAGNFVVQEPVSVSTAQPDGQSVDISATSPCGAAATTHQVLYGTTLQVTCDFAGRPGPDLTLLDAMLPDKYSISSAQTLIENFAPFVRQIRTQAAGYLVTVPGSTNLYAQTVHITRGSTVEYEGTGYSTRVILNPPAGWYDATTTGCVAVGGIA